MPFDRNLGKRCRYAGICPLYQGTGIPENMTRTLWRNVFCYRGIKGWSNCEKYHVFEKENTTP
jgi:hypothetical protein